MPQKSPDLKRRVATGMPYLSRVLSATQLELSHLDGQCLLEGHALSQVRR